MSGKNPIVMVSSWPPRKCGIATFAQEALEFIQSRAPMRAVHVICHTDGEGENVSPIIDPRGTDWHVPVAERIRELDPYVVHLQHEYGLYNHVDAEGNSDENLGFIKLLESIKDYPTVVEPHTVHGRMKDHEEVFIQRLTRSCNVVLFKCAYQRWRLGWNFSSKGWEVPRNIMIVPHGARPDKHFPIEHVPALKEELGLEALKDKHVMGLVGWIQSNKRWDIVTQMWEDIHQEILKRTGKEWVLLGAGDTRDPGDRETCERYIASVRRLQEKGLAYFYRFKPQGDIYYKVMTICDVVVLPSVDETQSGTLARIIASCRPYVTAAPLEGLTAQTLESGGGLLFTSKEMLREKILRLATHEHVRRELSFRLYRYLVEKVSWEVVASQYYEAYERAFADAHYGSKVDIAPDIMAG